METIRQSKVSRLLQKEIGEIIQQEQRGLYGNSMITVTRVTVTKDMMLARVFVSLFATKDKKELFDLVKLNTAEIRRLLAIRIRHQLRAVPDLEFIHDDTLDYIDHIDELLKQ